MKKFLFLNNILKIFLYEKIDKFFFVFMEKNVLLCCNKKEYLFLFKWKTNNF